MSLSDPTTGAGYAFGQILPSSHMTTIANQQVRAMDIVNGGTYAPTADVTLAGGTANKTIIWSTDGSANELWPGVSSRTIVVPIPLFVHSESTLSGGSDWKNVAGFLVQQYVTAAPDTYIQFGQVIRGATLTAISIGIVANSVPATKITLTLKKINRLTGAQTTITGPTTDPATGSGYTNYHLFTISGLSELIDTASSQAAHYQLFVTGDTGSGSSVGTQIKSASALFSVTALRS